MIIPPPERQGVSTGVSPGIGEHVIDQAAPPTLDLDSPFLESGHGAHRRYTTDRCSVRVYPLDPASSPPKWVRPLLESLPVRVWHSIDTIVLSLVIGRMQGQRPELIRGENFTAALTPASGFHIFPASFHRRFTYS